MYADKLATWCLVAAGVLSAQPANKPKLVVAIVVDQFRYDYLTRFRADYKGGLDRMLREGAVFTNARYQQAPTVTAVGHSIVTSGAMPAVSGIVGNTWVDRQTRKQVTSVCDYHYRLVGTDTPAPGPRCEDWDPASPKRLLVSTVGDELRNRDERSKVIGISLKARSAVLPAGHRANGAFWFDDVTGRFITSDYYSAELPAWVLEFNRQELADKFLHQPWKGFEAWEFQGENPSRPYEKIPASPWGNELIERLAEKAIDAEQLGQRDATDLLTLSFSSNDYVGHQTGPDAPEVRDMAIRTDALLADLFEAVSRKVGLDKALFVLSADHGVSPVPEVQEQRKMPGGSVFVDLEYLVRSALSRKFGAEEWVLGSVDNAIYLDYKVLARKNVDLGAACRVAADALLAMPQVHAARVMTREDLARGVSGDFITNALVNGFYAPRSGDIVVVFEPYYMTGQRAPTRTTHFSPYNYDTHVPVIFFGAGVKAGRYSGNISVNDIAPTLTTMLDVELPSGASGRVLTEMLRP